MQLILYFSQTSVSIASFSTLDGCLQEEEGAGICQGHYIGFRKISGKWYRFDDAVVHQVTLQEHYNVNIVMYRRHDTPAFISGSDLSTIPVLGKVTILNKRSTPVPRDDGKETPSQGDEHKGIRGKQRPPLITPSMPSPKSRSEIHQPSKTRASKRHQPARANKAYVVYYADDSASSSEEDIQDRTHSDSEYTPPNVKGMWQNLDPCEELIMQPYTHAEYLSSSHKIFAIYYVHFIVGSGHNKGHPP